MHLHGGQAAVAPRAGFDANAHRMPGRGTDELLLAGEFELDRLPGLQHGERDDVFDQHLLLGAKAAADPLAEHADFCRIEIEQRRHSARRARNGVCVLERMLRRSRFVEPAEGAVRFQVRVLHSLA